MQSSGDVMEVSCVRPDDLSYPLYLQDELSCVVRCRVLLNTRSMVQCEGQYP